MLFLFVNITEVKARGNKNKIDEKAIEYIRSELNLVCEGYDLTDPIICLEESIIGTTTGTTELQEILNKKINCAQCGNLTYGDYILSAIYEINFIESIYTLKYKQKFSEYFNKIVDQKTSFAPLILKSSNDFSVGAVISHFDTEFSTTAGAMAGFTLDSVSMTNEVVSIVGAVLKINKGILYDGLHQYLHGKGTEEEWDDVKYFMKYHGAGTVNIRARWPEEKWDALKVSFDKIYNHWIPYIDNDAKTIDTSPIRVKLKSVIASLVQKEHQKSIEKLNSSEQSFLQKVKQFGSDMIKVFKRIRADIFKKQKEFKDTLPAALVPLPTKDKFLESKIAYVVSDYITSKEDGFNIEYNIYLINEDGSNKELFLEQARKPSWSPDGSKLAYVRSIPYFEEGYYKTRQEIRLTDYNQSFDKKIGENTRLAIKKIRWSADGSKIFYNTTANKNLHYIDIATLKTGDIPILTESEAWTCIPSFDISVNNDVVIERISWKKDIKEMEWAILKTDIEGKNKKVIFSHKKIEYPRPIKRIRYERIFVRWCYEALSPTWSPDGSKITFTKDDEELMIVNQDGSNVHKIATIEINTTERGISWSPEGDKIIYTAGRRIPYLWLINTTGQTEPVKWIEGYAPSWSIVSVTKKEELREKKEIEDIKELPTFGDQKPFSTVKKTEEQKTQEEPQTTPAQTEKSQPEIKTLPNKIISILKIAYTNWDDGNSNIYLINQDGSNEELFIENAGNPVFSPNGEKIAYVVWDDYGYKIKVTDLNKTFDKLIYTSRPEERRPSNRPENLKWSSDNKKLLFVTWVFDADAEIRRFEPVYNIFSLENKTLTSTNLESLSQDHILYFDISEFSGDIVLETLKGWKLTPEGLDHEVHHLSITDKSGKIKYSLAGEYFMDNDRQNRPTPADFYPTWSPDGNQIAFVLWQQTEIKKSFSSPDNDYLIYQTNGKPYAIASLNPQTEKIKEIQILDISDHVNSLTWSPDSAKIAYQQDGWIWIINADGSGEPKKIVQGSYPSLAWVQVKNNNQKEAQKNYKEAIINKLKPDDGKVPKYKVRYSDLIWQIGDYELELNHKSLDCVLQLDTQRVYGTDCGYWVKFWGSLPSGCNYLEKSTLELGENSFTRLIREEEIQQEEDEPKNINVISYYSNEFREPFFLNGAVYQNNYKQCMADFEEVLKTLEPL